LKVYKLRSTTTASAGYHPIHTATSYLSLDALAANERGWPCELIAPDILVANAGISKAATIENTTVKDFDSRFAVNVRVPIFSCTAVANLARFLVIETLSKMHKHLRQHVPKRRKIHAVVPIRIPGIRECGKTHDNKKASHCSLPADVPDVDPIVLAV
jgi:NAD(P)-dependent dehydrogenase (short-subunit alcohol dehydrogenase family)